MSSESCNSRHLSRLMKSCFPENNTHKSISPKTIPATVTGGGGAIFSLPDDLLLECLSRIPSTSFPSLSVVCRRWCHLLHSSHFLRLRRRLHLVNTSVYAISASVSGLFAATLTFDNNYLLPTSWKVSLYLPIDISSLENFYGLLTHARVCASGPMIFIVGRNAMVRYDIWTGNVVPRSPMNFNRKKFACAMIAGKIYVAGGGSRAATAVEEYDPDANTWSVVSHAPRMRYGCIGVAVEGVFYVIGGLKVGGGTGGDISRATAGGEAHVYASSMDLYDVEARGWLRGRTVPGGGCVVAACGAEGHVYVLASHAVELSFWKFDARRNGNSGNFGEWSRLKSPPMPTQVRVDGTVRFSFVGVGDKVVLVQVAGCIDDLLRRSGRSMRGFREGLVLVFNTSSGEWGRVADLPEVIRRAACVSVEC